MKWNDYGDDFVEKQDVSRFGGSVSGKPIRSNADLIGVTKNGAGIVEDIITNPVGLFITIGPSRWLKVDLYERPHASCIQFAQELRVVHPL